MGKHRDDDQNANWEGGKVGGRPGREHPNGWGDTRRRTDADSTPPDVTDRDLIYGWGPDGVEGWH